MVITWHLFALCIGYATAAQWPGGLLCVVALLTISLAIAAIERGTNSYLARSRHIHANTLPLVINAFLLGLSATCAGKVYSLAKA